MRRCLAGSLLLLLLALGALAPAALAESYSVGSPSQIAWVRRAAGNFVDAELAASGSSACAILNAPLRGDEHGRSCEQRWDSRLSALLHQQGERARLHTLHRAIASARVVVHGNRATITLPEALMGGANRFAWSENCWMLAS